MGSTDMCSDLDDASSDDEIDLIKLLRRSVAETVDMVYCDDLLCDCGGV